MKRNRAKDYLKQVELLDIRINQKMKQRDELKALASELKSFDYSTEKVQSSGNPDGMSGKVSRYVDMEREIDTEIDNFVNLKDKIIREIQSLDDARYIIVLYMRYLNYKKFEEIAVELNYDYQHVRRLHGQALQAFEEKILNK